MAGFRAAGPNHTNAVESLQKSLEAAGAGGGQSVYALSNSGSLIRGGRQLIATYNSNPNLRKVVGLISNSLVAVPWFLRKRVAPAGSKSKQKSWPLHLRACSDKTFRNKAILEDSEITFDHPFLDFLHRGSPLMPGPQGLKASYSYREIKGEFFWHLLQGEDAAPAAWMVMPPQCVNQIPRPGAEFFEVTAHGKVVRIPEGGIFWVRDLDLSNIWGRGSGIGDALADELDSDEYAAQLLRIVLANKGFKDTLISIKPEAGATPGIAEQLEAKYNQRSRGFYNSGRAMVVDGASIEVKSLTHDLKELQLLDLRNFERDIIYQTFGIPPELFGLVQNSNRATIDGAQTIYTKQVLEPRLESMRLEMQLRLLPLFDPAGEYILDYVSPVPEDKERRLSVMQAQPTAFTINDWRKEAGLEMTPWGEARTMPFGVLDQPLDTPNLSLEIATDKATKSLEKQTGAAYTQAEIEQILSKIDSAELVEKIGPGWQDRVTRFAQVAYDQFPQGVGSFGVINPLIEDHMKEFAARFVQGIDVTTKQRVGKAIADGIAGNESTQEIAKRVSQQMGYLADGYRSTMIARTEIVRSSNAASLMGWKATGLPLRRRYISALTSGTREAHAALHNAETTLDGTWSYDASLEPFASDTISSPGNSSVASHAVNCLCTDVAFDPDHTRDIGDLSYNSELHQQVAKSFESKVNDWEDWATDLMVPFYSAMTREVVREVERLGQKI